MEQGAGLEVSKKVSFGCSVASRPGGEAARRPEITVAGQEVVLHQEKGSPLGKILGKRLDRTLGLEASRQQNWVGGAAFGQAMVW